MPDHTAKIHELRQELERLEAEQKGFDSLPEDFRLAELLHEQMCHADHTEHCCWHYDSWDKMRDGEFTARRVYLRKAQAILGVSDFGTAAKVMAALKTN